MQSRGIGLRGDFLRAVDGHQQGFWQRFGYAIFRDIEHHIGKWGINRTCGGQYNLTAITTGWDKFDLNIGIF